MPKAGAGPVHPVRWSALLAAAAFVVAAFVGCATSPELPPPPQEEDEYLAGPAGEPIEIDYLFPGDDEPTPITAELYEDMVLIQGDILLGSLEELTNAASGLGTQSHAVPAAGSYWPATTASAPYLYEVPYEVSSDFSDDYVDDVIEPAIAHWQDETNLRFVPRSGEADYVEIVVVNGRCWSEAGRQGGRQELGLDESSCTSIGTVVHELGHAAGLKHEQQRPDRGDYVTIREENVKPGKIGNFDIFQSGLPLGPYGYDSVMHYSTTAFGITDADGNKLTTIESLGGAINPSSRLTDLDLAGVRRLYPERDLPIVDITLPAATTTLDEGELVRFEAQAVMAPTIDYQDLNYFWSYENNLGVPVTFGSGDTVSHSFCDGPRDVTVEALVLGMGVIATDTVRVNVSDLGLTGPPAKCGISVQIDEPLAGAVYAEGEAFDLVAVIDDDHPETEDPLYPVTWRLSDPGSGPIVGTGLHSSTKLGAGQHTIFVTYGAASDSVEVTVVEAGTPPVASISDPADETLFTWSELDGVNPYLDINFAGSASDAQDGALSGSALVWQTRFEASGAYDQKGTGTSPTLRFGMSSGTTRYDVRLSATDADGMTSTALIQVVIVWPPS